MTTPSAKRRARLLELAFGSMFAAALATSCQAGQATGAGTSPGDAGAGGSAPTETTVHQPADGQRHEVAGGAAATEPDRGPPGAGDGPPHLSGPSSDGPAAGPEPGDPARTGGSSRSAGQGQPGAPGPTGAVSGVPGAPTAASAADAPAELPLNEPPPSQQPVTHANGGPQVTAQTVPATGPTPAAGSAGDDATRSSRPDGTEPPEASGGPAQSSPATGTPAAPGPPVGPGPGSGGPGTAGPGAGGADADGSPNANQGSSVLWATTAEESFLDRLNGERAKLGLPTLVVDANLTSSARTQVQWMIDNAKLAHQDLHDELVQGWTIVGENVGYGPNVGVVHDALVASPGHYANIVHTRYAFVGIGVQVDHNGRMWVAQVFAG